MLHDHRNFTRPAEVVTATLPSVVRALLDALHESRRRQANRIIHDHSHLLAKPQQIAELVKSTGEEQRDVD
jgi:hypothetical protein